MDVFENAVKGFCVLEAGLVDDLGDRKPGREKQSFGLLQAKCGQVLVKMDPGMAAEKAAEKTF